MYKDGIFSTTYPLSKGRFTVPQRTLKVILDMTEKEERTSVEFISDNTEVDGNPNPNGERITKTYTRQNLVDLEKSNMYDMKNSPKGMFKLYYIDTKDPNFFFTTITESPVTPKTDNELVSLLRQKYAIEEQIKKLI